MDTFEKDVIKISINEIEKYGDLIFDLKIKEFAFYYGGKVLANTDEKNWIAIVYSPNYMTNYYFSLNFKKTELSIIENLNTSTLYFPEENKRNNILNCIKMFISSILDKEVEEVKLYCPELISNVKPGKR